MTAPRDAGYRALHLDDLEAVRWKDACSCSAAPRVPSPRGEEVMARVRAARRACGGPGAPRRD